MKNQTLKPDSKAPVKKAPSSQPEVQLVQEAELASLRNAARAAESASGDPLEKQTGLLHKTGLQPAQKQTLAAQLGSAYGNASLQRLVASGQTPAGQVGSGVVQREDGETDHIAQLDEMLDAFNTPEDDVITILGELTPAEKVTVLEPRRGYKQKTADALNVEEMIRAVRNLNPPLVTKLEWVWAATIVTSATDYSEIQSLITASPAPEYPDVARLKPFFLDVCDNTTIVQAVTDLQFDLLTQLDWIRSEMTSVRMELDYATIKSLITMADQPSRDRLKTADWRDFFVSVCTNDTMVEALGDLQFDLPTKLDWLRAEMLSVRAELDYTTIQPMITSASTPEKEALKTDVWREFFTQVCDNETILTAVTDLEWDLATRLDWFLAEGRDFAAEIFTLLADQEDAVRQAVQANTAVMGYLRSELTALEFWRVQLILKYGAQDAGPDATNQLLDQLLASASAIELRRLFTQMSEVDFAILTVEDGVREVIKGTYTAVEYEPLIRMLNGEPIAEETGVTRDLSETLLVGETTGTFTEREFGGTAGFDVAYLRDRLQVTVRVSLVPIDPVAAAQLPAAQPVWETNIESAWNRFNIANGEVTIPLNFDIVFTSGNPHHVVNVHPNAPVGWPSVDMNNWWTQSLISPNHEFGHMLGNPDEYFISAEHFREILGYLPSEAPAGEVTTDTDTAGTSRYATTNSIMGSNSGAAVQPRHLDYFVDWVNEHRIRNAEGEFAEPEFSLE